jgi:hypothetical protein
MAKDVECERVRGFISQHAILLDRLRRDPVEITRDRASKRAHVRTPVGRLDRRILRAAGDSAARPRRLLVPQPSLDLGHAGPAQLLPRKDDNDGREESTERQCDWLTYSMTRRT